MKIPIVFLTAVLLAGMGTAAAQQTDEHAKQNAGAAILADPAAERIENIDALKEKLRQYHACTCTCGCYTRDLDNQADQARAFLDKRAAQKRANEKLALVLDIDETTLSNFKELTDADFAYNAPVFDAWAESAQAPAIGGTLRLYKDAQRLGVAIFFITGRQEKQRAVTERNLRAQGFDGWAHLYMRPAEHVQQATSEYKSAMRKQIVAQGYTLALNVGDQWSDLKGAPEAELDVKYPDPFYLIP